MSLAVAGGVAPALAGVESAICLQPDALHDPSDAPTPTPEFEIASLRLAPVRITLHHRLWATPAPESPTIDAPEPTLNGQSSDLSLEASPESGWRLDPTLVNVDDERLARALRTESDSPLAFGPSLRLHFDRPTSLRDGGIGGSNTSLSNTPTEDRIYGFENSQGQFDLYDISLRWSTVQAGPVSFSLIGGVKAVSTDVTEGVAEYDAGGNYVSTRAEDEYRMVPVPIVGGSFRWDVDDRFYLVGTAQTHTIPDGNTLLDLTAETGIDFSPTVGLRAGYTYVRTAVELEQFDARLSQSGVFARVEISF